jgi:hypothetical protein
MPLSVLRLAVLLVVATVLGSAPPTAGGSAAAEAAPTGCPAGTVCDHALGVALVLPSQWRQLPAGKLPAHTIGLFALPVRAPSYNIRLIIASDGTTRERNDVRAATLAAGVFIRGYSRLRMRPPLVRIPVRYGGAPGVMIRNLPGQPTLVTVIILAHRGALYRIVAPGATLDRDQRQALGSVRFITRVGPFPPANPPAPKSRR